MMLPPIITSVTFLGAILLPVIVGFLIGILIKKALSLGTILALLVVILIVAGLVSPDQVIGPIISAFKEGAAVGPKIEQIVAYLPYSSVTYLVGLALGFFKG